METENDPTDEIFVSGEEVFMREPVKRKHGKGVWLQQEFIVTCSRVIFRGEAREGAIMELMLSDIKETKIGKDPQDRKIQVPVLGIVPNATDLVDIVVKFNPTDPQSLTKVRLIDKYIQKMRNPLESGDERKLKTRLLVKNKVLCRVYKSLVQQKKYLTDEQFWERHNFVELNEYQLLQRTESIKHLQEVKRELYQEFKHPPKVFYDKDDPEYLKKELNNLSLASSKAEEINGVTHEAIYREVEELYMKDMKYYEKYVHQEPQLDNEGVSEPFKPSVEAPLKEEHVTHRSKAQPMRIPDITPKFEAKSDSLMQFLQKNRPRKADSSSSNPMRDITIKTVEYLKIFYDRMSHQDADKLQKQIRNLQKEVEVDKTGELAKFIQRSIDNYMKQRRQMSSAGF